MLLGEDRVRLPAGLATEWLLTNGIGGYAMGTAAGIATRGYHGWLVAAEAPPGGRRLRLAKVEIWAQIGSVRYALDANLYPEAVYPDGNARLVSFSATPEPTWRYALPGGSMELCLMLVPGHNIGVARLRWQGTEPCVVFLRPLVNDRGHHDRTHRGALCPRIRTLATGFAVDGTEGGTLRVEVEILPAHSVEQPPNVIVLPDPEPVWVERMRYPEEGKRGYPELDDHLSPGVVQTCLRPGDALAIRTSVGTSDVEDAPGGTSQPVPTCASEAADDGIAPRVRTEALLADLDRAAAAFLVRDEAGRPQVLAGYPWFDRRTRDTCIAVAGLFLVRGDLDTAYALLEDWGGRLARMPGLAGLDDQGQPFGMTADAPLHYVLAVYRLWAYGGNVTALLPTVGALLAAYVQGYGPGQAIRTDPDGLVRAVLPGHACTWMDGGDAWPRTPRDGYPVEVNALWYKALRAAARLGASVPHTVAASVGGDWAAAADRVWEAFRRMFLRPEGGLFDRRAPDGTPDASIRPNQLYAAAVPFPLLHREEAADLLEMVEPHLWTPRGLRTLSPEDPHYRGRYEGDPEERASAYHQGTVWPFLTGVWADAHHHAYPMGSGPQALRDRLEALRPMLEEDVLGQIAELYDGDFPQRPRGAPAYALSVAELRRVLVEWGLGRAPRVLDEPHAGPGVAGDVERGAAGGSVLDASPGETLRVRQLRREAVADGER